MIVVWLVVTTTLLVGLLTIGVERAAGDPYQVLDVQLVPTEVTSPEGDPVVYPSVLYGGLEWAMVESRVVPRSDELFSRPVVVVEVLVRNTTESTPLRVRDSDLSVIFQGDGSRHETDRFEGTDNGSRFVVEPGQIVSVALVFKLKLGFDPQLDQLELEISEPQRIPARLPLSGAIPQSAYPIEVEIGNEQAMVADPNDQDRNLIIAPQKASIDINEGPYRAAVGENLTIFEVSVQRTSSEGAAFYEETFWELEVGDERLSPVRVSKTGQPAANEDEVTLLFVIASELDDTTSDSTESNGTALAGNAPELPEGMVLTVGANTPDRYSYQIDIPVAEPIVISEVEVADSPPLVDNLFGG